MDYLYSNESITEEPFSIGVAPKATYNFAMKQLTFLAHEGAKSRPLHSGRYMTSPGTRSRSG